MSASGVVRPRFHRTLSLLMESPDHARQTESVPATLGGANAPVLRQGLLSFPSESAETAEPHDAQPVPQYAAGGAHPRQSVRRTSPQREPTLFDFLSAGPDMARPPPASGETTLSFI